jgi:predicted DCC family thiol-disulfide oxidoreductase YuxK
MASPFLQPLKVIYDANCKLCCRTVAFLRALDFFKRITFISAFDQTAIHAAGLSHLDPNALMADMHASDGVKVWKGYESYRVISWRIPLLWPLMPFLYLWPVTAIGRGIYRRVADSRTCALPKPPKAKP